MFHRPDVAEGLARAHGVSQRCWGNRRRYAKLGSARCLELFQQRQRLFEPADGGGQRLDLNGAGRVVRLVGLFQGKSRQPYLLAMPDNVAFKILHNTLLSRGI